MSTHRCARQTLLSIWLRFLCMTIGVSSEGGIPSYRGPQQCLNDPTIKGYNATPALMDDMIAMVASMSPNGTELPGVDIQYPVFTFCPQTDFDLGMELEKNGTQVVPPIIPLLHNSVFICGKDGDPRNECVMKGGLYQVLFEDDFIVKNATFIGFTFEESRGGSVAAFGHPYSEVFFGNCIWKNNFGSDTLVHLFWDEDLPFFWEPDERRRRIKQLMGPKDKLKNTKGIGSASPDHVTKVVNRNLQQDSDPDPGMYAAFIYCVFSHNEMTKAVILNSGGRLELIGSIFESNLAIAIVGNIQKALLGMNGTIFIHNQDLIGPVFVDKTSHLYLNEDTRGESNTGIVLLDSPGTGCQGVFIELPHSECLPVNVDLQGCEGDCCEFGDETCDIYEESLETPVAPITVPEFQNDRPESSGCNTNCIISVAVVSVVVVITIALGVWYVRREKNSGSDASVAAELEIPQQKQSATIA